MFNLSNIRVINKALVTGVLAIYSIGANAALTSYSSDGVDLVYSSVSDVTWTKDSNLFTSMAKQEGTYNKLIRKIIAAIPTVETTIPSPSGMTTYRVGTYDFSEAGVVNWYGAMAFAKYLNSIKYAGSTEWRLPTVIDLGSDGCNFSYSGTDCGINSATNGTLRGNEFAELYYKELGIEPAIDTQGLPTNSVSGINPDNHFFTGLYESDYIYWTGSELPLTNPLSRSVSWYFDIGYGEQNYTAARFQKMSFWAIAPGRIGVVPEPESEAMILVGLGLIGLMSRRRPQYY